MRSIRRKIQHILASRVRRRGNQPTLDDLYYCYRLLLRREPDPEGWNFYKDEILNGRYDLAHLVDLFLYSDEFIRLQEEAAQPVLVELDGFNLYVRRNDFFVGAYIERERTYEPHVDKVLREMLKAGDVFVDIGANIGYFTLLAAALVGPDGAVYAFEPNTDNNALIEMSLKANSFDNVVIQPYAVAEAQQTFQLDVAGSGSNARVIDFSPRAVPGSGRERHVEAVTLDEALGDVDRIDVIKMDIEGAEPRAWQGMAQTIERLRPAVLFELSPMLIEVTSHVSTGEFLSQVAGQGYGLFVIDRQAGLLPDAQTPEQILQRLAATNLSHLDLMAK